MNFGRSASSINAPLGLVLAGGKSTRMGRDKGSLIYTGGETQRLRCRRLLTPVCTQVYLSCREEQITEIIAMDGHRTTPEGWGHDHLLIDSQEECGPVSGLLAAFQKAPEKPWFVLACDFPWADEEAIRFVMKNRNARKAATVFGQARDSSGRDSFLEPFFGIWEPEALAQLAKEFQNSHLSPRRVLEALSCEVLRPPNERVLVNVNTWGDRIAAVQPVKITGFSSFF